MRTDSRSEADGRLWYANDAVVPEGDLRQDRLPVASQRLSTGETEGLQVEQLTLPVCLEWYCY